MLLKNWGHEVTVLERDSQPAPSLMDRVWREWERQGVSQFRQPHILQAAGHDIFESHLPEVSQALLDIGCVRFDISRLMPPTITDRERRLDDDRFLTVTGRRPAIEYAVARVAEATLPIERGVTVAG